MKIEQIRPERLSGAVLRLLPICWGSSSLRMKQLTIVKRVIHTTADLEYARNSLLQ